MKKIMYIMDPQCGWCYGNSDNIQEIFKDFADDYHFELKVGGMWTGSDAPSGGQGFNQFIEEHSPRMEQYTGAFVSKDFYELTKDSTYQFSSLEPSLAIHWVKKNYPEQSFRFAHEVQKKLFAEGKRLDQIESYESILDELKIDSAKFKEEWLSDENKASTQQEFLSAQNLANGFPTLLMENDDNVIVLASGYFDLRQMKEKIKSLL